MAHVDASILYPPPFHAPPPEPVGVGGPLPPPPPYLPAWPAPPYLPGRTRAALISIRQGIRRYGYLLLVDILVAVLSGAVATAEGGPFLSSLSPVGGGSALGFGPSGLVVLAASAVAGLVGLVLLILSWVDWRSGIKALYEQGSEYGAAHQEDILRAHRDYTITVVMFFLNLVGSTLTSLVVTLLVVGRAARSGQTLTPAQLPGLIAPAILLTFAVTATFSTLLYYFAGRSLAGTIRALLSPVERAAVDRGPLWMALGAIVAAPAGVAALYVPGLALLTVLAPIITLYGLRLVGRGYDAWVGAPSAAPPPAPPLAWPMLPREREDSA